MNKHFSARYLLIPFAYPLLVKNLNKYYLNNELRYLYKQDLLVPWLRRIDDHHCSDNRDIKHELDQSWKVDLERSVVQKQRDLVRSKGLVGSEGRAKPQHRESNLNVIKR